MAEQSKSREGAPVEQSGAGTKAESRARGNDMSRLEPGQRWSVSRKREVVLRLLRGESVEAGSREVGVEIYRLEEWREKALAGLDAGLKERVADAGRQELAAAMRRVGELTMEVELLQMKADMSGPLAKYKSRR